MKFHSLYRVTRTIVVAALHPKHQPNEKPPRNLRRGSISEANHRINRGNTPLNNPQRGKTTNQGSEEQLPMLDGVKLAPNKAYGSYTGSASLPITDKDGLLAMISGLSRISTGAANSKTLGSSLSNKNAPATPPNAPMVT